MSPTSGTPADQEERPHQQDILLSGITKIFGTTRVLDNVTLDLAPGEVHALLGENGSGKSTLIKVLAGFYTPEGGTLDAYGSRYDLPLDATQREEIGLSFVHQDLGLIPSLSVVENLRLVMLSSAPAFRPISWRSQVRWAQQVLGRYGVTNIDARQPVSELGPLDRALLAIVRAVEAMSARGHDRGVLVLDEPTVFLPRTGVQQLFDLVREITARGPSVLFVSHDLDEVLEIADRVTVLRDGRMVGTRVCSEVDSAALIELILGRSLGAMDVRAEEVEEAGPALLKVQGLTTQRLRDVAFDVRAGEVVGLTGLAGSGFEDIPYHLFGATRAGGGTMTVNDQQVDLRAWDPRRALRAGMALIPAERRIDGVAIGLSVEDNITMQSLGRYRAGLGLSRSRRRADAARLCEEFDVRPRRPEAGISSLSGGNQQKVVLAKWLTAKPKLLLLHEPTQGVDVGAREQIFAMVRSYTEAGNSVVCASSDHDQLALICHRVIVFSRGVPVAELSGSQVTKEAITERTLASSSADIVHST